MVMAISLFDPRNGWIIFIILNIDPNVNNITNALGFPRLMPNTA